MLFIVVPTLCVAYLIALHKFGLNLTLYATITVCPSVPLASIHGLLFSKSKPSWVSVLMNSPCKFQALA